MSDNDWHQFIAHARSSGIDIAPFESMVRSASPRKRDEVGELALRLLEDGSSEDEVVMAAVDCVLR